ncbi:hypothetical protein [Clostridium kluyveri]|uniref:Uncharacterized protein n=1 Tax=Clostridium kluyveri TaxID=1534 RepID=A0A1L5F5Q8_CLOKL|nr:hypothetical protein [Clostridium kluyveri]APM38338.1 hypothetical protein BS101_06075 [Clostridium kluyveri]UZQ50621.1 hypothetical protein OP486_00080 [Clostridium kluyveri]
MEQYKNLNILENETDSQVNIKNVFVDIKLMLNICEDGFKKDKGMYTMTVFDIADKIKDKISHEGVSVQLYGYSGNIIKMKNVTISYVENDVILESKQYTKIVK